MLYTTLLSTRVINIASGLLCLLIVAGTYEAVSAGRIYTMLSLAGAAALFELGLSTLVLQRASQATRDQGWDPADPAKSRALITPILGRYLLIVCLQSLLLLAVLIPVGLWVIVGVFKEPFGSLGVFAWVITCLTMCLGLPTAILLSALEGLGQLSEVARVRALQASTSLLALNLPLLLGAGYLAVAIQLVCALAIGWIALWAWSGSFMRLIFRHVKIQTLKGRVWLDWPFQWRLSLSFLSGYFSNQAWVVAISLTGAVALAGHVAMTLQVLTAIVGFAMTPIAARLPTLSALACRDSRNDYFDLVKVLTRQVVLIFSVMVAVVVSGYIFANFLIPEIKSRLLPLGPLSVILFCAPLMLCLAALTTLNQSLGRDDLYLISVFRIVAPISAIAIGGGDLSAWSFTFSFATITVLSTLVGMKVHRRSLVRNFS